MSEEHTFGAAVTPESQTYTDLNAELNLPGENNEIQFDKDKEAARQYFLTNINLNTVYFHDLEEKIHYMTEETQYYRKELFDMYEWDFVKELYKKAYAYKFRFPSFIGAYKFYTQYALKTFDGSRYLERYEDRVTIVALELAQGDEELAQLYVDEMMTGRMQPATPTFSNAGRAFGGALVSCYLLDTQDNLESIMNRISSAAQLSKIGGGVGINITNVRSSLDPIQNVDGVASGVVPYMKVLEDTFSWINQLGTRPGSGAVYISIHHPNVLDVLDTKRENADEKVRIKTLSVGLVVTDLLFEMAKKNDDIYQFSPYDVEKVYGKPFSQISVTDNYQDMVEDPRIKKTKVNARKLFQTIAELQFESGYPYIMFEDNVNRANNTPNIGRIAMSNLCSEILQPQTVSTYHADMSYDEVGMDISCNLASLNIARMMDNAPNFETSVKATVHALTSVSDQSDIAAVPSVQLGNRRSHAIGIGAMNLHGFLGSNHIKYGSFEALDFVNIYFSTVLFYALKASNEIARERKGTFWGFEDSLFATGKYFTPFLNARFSIDDPDEGGHDLFIKTEKVKNMIESYGLYVPQREDWDKLAQDIKEHGLYNRNLIAVAPTGSISMVNHSTMSIHPIADPITVRKEGKIGRVYWAAPGMTQENVEYFRDNAFDLGARAVIDTYNTAAPYVDQGLAQTLFFKDSATTRDLNRAYGFAWGGTDTFHGNDFEGANTPWNRARRQKLGAVSKTIYYIRINQKALDGTQVETINECISCQI